MPFCKLPALRTLLAGAALLGSWGCTLHQVRDEPPNPIKIDGEPATVAVERAPAHFGGQRLLVTVDHPDFIDLDSATGALAELATTTGGRLDNCFRESLDRIDLGESRRRSQVRFRCRYPLTQPVVLLTGDSRIPLLGPRGQEVIDAPRPWLFSAFARGELDIPTTTQNTGVNLGANIGMGGLLADQHLHLGGRADVVGNTQSGSGSALFGPEVGFVHSTWPCARCSVETTASYLLGYSGGGFAQGAEVDLRVGVRVARTGLSWHGIEGGVGFRYLVGPAVSGAMVLTLSYSLMTSLRGQPLPVALRARPAQLTPEEDVLEPPRILPPDNSP